MLMRHAKIMPCSGLFLTRQRRSCRSRNTRCLVVRPVPAEGRISRTAHACTIPASNPHWAGSGRGRGHRRDRNDRTLGPDAVTIVDEIPVLPLNNPPVASGRCGAKASCPLWYKHVFPRLTQRYCVQTPANREPNLNRQGCV